MVVVFTVFMMVMRSLRMLRLRLLRSARGGATAATVATVAPGVRIFRPASIIRHLKRLTSLSCTVGPSSPSSMAYSAYRKWATDVLLSTQLLFSPAVGLLPGIPVSPHVLPLFLCGATGPWQSRRLMRLAMQRISA